MSPIERMEEAYRLFRIVQEDAEGEERGGDEEGGGG